MRTRFPTAALTLLTAGACGPAPVSPALVLPSVSLVASPRPAERPALVGYVAHAVAVCDGKGRLSPAVRAALAEDVAAVISGVYSTETEAQAFVGLLCIESAFDQSVRSPAGAIGIAQILPAFATDFARECGPDAPSVGPADVGVLAVNLRLGACHFRTLLRAAEGNIPLALAAYNAGSTSSTVAKLRAGGTGATETSGYLARHYVLTESLRGGTTP